MEKLTQLQQLKEVYERLLENTKENLNGNLNRLQNDFENEFTWNAKSAYTNSVQVRLYELIIGRINEDKLDMAAAEISEFVSRIYNVRSTSTCELTNASSTWKYIVYSDTLEQLKKNINWTK